MLRNTFNTFISATLIMLLGVSSSASAQEDDEAPLRQMHLVVPANSKITSTSELTIGDKPLSGSVAVTVGLQRSKPEIALKEVTVDGELFEGDPGDVQWLHGKTKTLTYTYTITTTANGLATYSVSAEVAQDDLSGTPSTEVDGDTISLGATAAISNQGLAVTVPYDGAADGVINGISPKAIVVINNQPYEVNNLRDSADASTLTLDKDPGELSPGTPIAEQQEYTVTLLGVVLADDAPEGGTNPTLTITATQGAGFEGFDAAPNNQSFLVTAVNDAPVANLDSYNAEPFTDSGVNYCYNTYTNQFEQGNVIADAACQAAVNEWTASWGLEILELCGGVPWCYDSVYLDEGSPCYGDPDGDTCVSDGQM